jgi:hypothetical protein
MEPESWGYQMMQQRIMMNKKYQQVERDKYSMIVSLSTNQRTLLKTIDAM